jgi:hypothetical protein
LPSATPTSTAPPSTARRNKRWLVAQVVLTAVVFWFVARALVAQWREFRGVPLVVHPNWFYIAASGALFWATYAVLIETLRRLLLAWDGGTARLGFMTVARFWAISNFGRYLPGKVWGIGAMAAMAQQAGVGGVAAAGSAVLNTIVNIITGAIVALVAGWASFDRISQGRTELGVALVVVAVAGLFALPLAFPPMLSIARRVTGRELAVSNIPRRAFYIALGGNLLSWLMYGAAFEVFVHGVLGAAPGTLASYVTAYAWPYVLGYLAILAPGGLGVREVALAQTLTALSIATPPQALLISATSRLWLTVLELLPGLLFLATGTRPRSQALH